MGEADMRRAVLILVLAGAVTAAAGAAPAEFANLDAVQRWIYGYRARPDPAHVPDAVRMLSRLGAFRDTENSGVYVGFLAGIIGANPGKADALVARLLGIKAEDHWVIVRAIAYSGEPGWQDLLHRFADRMPSRALMIERYADGKRPTLDDIAYDNPNAIDRLRDYSTSFGSFISGREPPPAAVTLEASPEVLDTLWGYYFATAKYGPLARIIRMLPWSKDRSSADKLTVGSMAKYTLASNAARDAGLLAALKRATGRATAEEKPVLDDVIEAVETMDLSRIRKEALAAIEELKRKGPGYKRDIAGWGQIGQGALALGCIAAAAVGQVEFGLPCVVGGVASSAALNYWTKD
jgi:hypothetical protein